MEGTEINWDQIEAAGHDFTLISGPVAGRCIYYCENCCTLMLLCKDRIELWQSPHGNSMCTPRRIKGETVKEKIQKLDAEILKKIGAL